MNTALAILAGIVTGLLLVWAAPWVARAIMFARAVWHDSTEDDEMAAYERGEGR